MRLLLVLVVLLAACSDSKSSSSPSAKSSAPTAKPLPPITKALPTVAKRNLGFAMQAADAALEACAKLYREPEGCFRYRHPGETWGDNAPNIAIADFWTGSKDDIAALQAECTWSKEAFARAFQRKPEGPGEAALGISGSPTCAFHPYPSIPEYLNPGTPDCDSATPYSGFDFLNERTNSESVLVPTDNENCAGQWEAIEVSRVSADNGVRLRLKVWLKGPKA